MARRLFAVFAVVLVPSLAAAAPVTFDLRGPGIDGILDEVNSFPLTVGGITAVLTALPTTFNEPPLRNVVLNQTASSFGINVVGTSCGGPEESGLLDGGCTGESIQVVLNRNVFLNSLRVSNFGADAGLVTIGALTIPITATGDLALGNVFLASGSPFLVAFTAGNGFSFDNFVVTAPEPTMLLLLGAGAVGVLRRRQGRV